MFDNNLFVFQSLDGKKQLTKTTFNKEHFWIQLHGLLVHYMNRHYRELIGNTIGRVLDVDVENDNMRGGSLRVRVILNLFKPLARGKTILVMGEDL